MKVVLFVWVVVAYSTNVHLVLDVSPRCAAGADVVARHQKCNATPVPWFPAKVVGTDALEGKLILAYGYSAEPPGNWTDATTVPGASVSFYECRDQGWKKGDAGRGFQYLPNQYISDACNHTECAVGCRVVPSGGCVEGDRIAFGETCTTQCREPGYLPSRARVTCDLQLAPRLRTFQCRSTSTCQQQNSTANGSNTTCDDSTTSTTTLRTTDRLLRGCSELKKLSPGELDTNTDFPPLPVGMPNVKVESGGIYFEVLLEGSMDVVGWVDNAWNPNGGASNAEHQWLSSPGNPGEISVTLQVLDDGIADAWFARDGTLEKRAEILFEPPLIPVALLRNRAIWRIPESSWTYSPTATGDIFPFTRQLFPSSCAYPPTVKLFDSPGQCRDGFQQLNTSDECKDAAFTIGLEDISPTVGNFPGYPGGCFQCLECDLSGNLYLNENPDHNNSAEDVMRLLPAISAVCAWFDPRFATTTAKKSTQRFTTTTLEPPRFKRSGICEGAFVPINHSGECNAAAAWLGFHDSTVEKVNLSNSLGNWPMGCFHCLICDGGSLYFNGPDQKDVDERLQDAREAAMRAAMEAAIKQNQSGFNSSTNAVIVNKSSNTTARSLRRTSTKLAGNDFIVELLCKSNSTQTTTTLHLEASTSLFADVSLKTTSTRTTTSTSTSMASTLQTTTSTTTKNTMGILTCKDPYGREEELPWWQQPAMLAIAGGSFLLCCCSCCTCFIKGGFSKCCKLVKKCICENRCMKRCKELCGRCSRKKAKKDVENADAIDDQQAQSSRMSGRRNSLSSVSSVESSARVTTGRRNSLSSVEALQKMGVKVNTLSDAEQEVAMEAKKRKALEAEIAKYEANAENEHEKHKEESHIILSPRAEQNAGRERRQSISSVFQVVEEPEEDKKDKKKKHKEPPPVVRRASLAGLPGAAGRRNSLPGRRPSLVSLPDLPPTGAESFPDEIFMSDARLGSKGSSGGSSL